MTQGFVVAPDRGQAFAFLGGKAVYKASVEQTGSWNLAVETSPAGFASALHVHRTEDSGFYVLEGTIRVHCGDSDWVASQGTFVFLPRGVPHAFRVEGDGPATWLNIQGPTGDFRKYVQAIGEPVAPGAELTADTRTDPATRAALAEKYNLEIVGPPPF